MMTGSYPSNTWTWLDGNRDGVSDAIALMQMVGCM